eukprot:scaffold79587_cov52-Prasinocladus_malaysianus.AAC.1
MSLYVTEYGLRTTRDLTWGTTGGTNCRQYGDVPRTERSEFNILTCDEAQKYLIQAVRRLIMRKTGAHH